MSERVINWTWSNSKDDFIGFWPIGGPLPDNLLVGGDLIHKTRESFMKGALTFFEPFKVSQPLTWSRLTTSCQPAALVKNKMYPTLVDIVAVANDLVVFIEPFNRNDDLRKWTDIYSSMPEFLRAYYTNFNGMRASYSNLFSPHNLPANVAKWRRVADYRKEERLSKKPLKRMEIELGDLEYVDIFIETEWRDIVMLNHNSKDGKVYVAPRGDFDKFFELNNAASTIDALCSHVISGAIEPYFLEPKSLP